MTLLPEQRPSWLSTILFALLAFLFALVLGASFLNAWIPPVLEISLEKYQDDFQRWAKEDGDRDRRILWIAIGFGIAGAILAGLGWRAPREKCFHIAYLSGLGILILTYSQTQVLLNRFLARGSIYWNQGGVPTAIITPIVPAIFAIVVGLVLCLTALIQDRRPR